MIHDYYVPLTTENVMSVSDMVRECHVEKWSPIIVIQYNDGRIVVPTFRNHHTAMKFIFRNFGKKVKNTSGTIGVNKEHFELFEQKNWEIEIFDFPKLFKNRKDANLEIEVFEIPQGFHMPNQGI